MCHGCLVRHGVYLLACVCHGVYLLSCVCHGVYLLSCVCHGVYLLACMCHFQGGNFHLKVGGGGLVTLRVQKGAVVLLQY